MKLGEVNIKKICLGTEEVLKVYLGETLIYEKENEN